MHKKLQAMKCDLKGTGVALVTPFNKDSSIDFSGLDKLIHHVIKGGVDYLVVNGTTGESATLSNKEKLQILKFVVEKNIENTPVIYGIGGNNTSEIISNMGDLDYNGIDALLSVSPYYNRPTQQGIIYHFNAIADQSKVPVILYNVPSRTSSNLEWETTVELSKHENIIGIKEASGDLYQCMQVIANTNDEFITISGDDMLTLPMMSFGAQGVISVLANAFPSHFKEIVHGNTKEAIKGLFSLLDINPLMYTESNPVGVKEVLNQLGICNNYVRSPLLAASGQLADDISSALNKLAY
jgi:4-hydroxy-tetrahydrodipicolinate synthase